MYVSALEAILGSLDRIVRLAAGAALLVMTLLLFGNSTARFLFGLSFVGGEELARVLTVWMTFMAAYLVVRKNSHVAIDILMRLVDERLYRAITFAVSLIAAFTMAYITRYGVEFSHRVWASGQESSVLPMLRVVFYLPIPIGCGLMSLGFLINAVKVLRGELPRPALEGMTSAPAGE
ncbi:MAG: TRAP transporter small permease [Alphaproteobacteria bacterium]